MFFVSSGRVRYMAFIGLLLSIFTLGSSIEAQPPDRPKGLTLSGNVRRFGKSLNGSGYEVLLRMQFRNDGMEPIIVYRVYDKSGLVSKRLDFFHQSLGSAIRPPDSKEVLLITETEAPANPLARYRRQTDDFDPRPGMVLDFDAPRPTSAFVVLDPQEYHEFEDAMFVKTDIDLEAEQGHFVIEYDLSISRFEEKPDLLQVLRNRWLRYGQLPLDSSNHFNVRSQKILHIGKIG